MSLIESVKNNLYERPATPENWHTSKIVVKRIRGFNGAKGNIISYFKVKNIFIKMSLK